MNKKQLAGQKAASLVEDGMIVGLGTGSTARYAVETIARRRREENIVVQGVPTSEETRALAESLDIPLLALADIKGIDMTIDGADEVDDHFNGIKGGGGALLVEKIVATASRQNIWIVDDEKQVDQLGRFPLPIEVIPMACPQVLRTLSREGLNATQRYVGHEAFVTDHGNVIIDIQMARIEKPEILATWLNMIPGVVENGLFLDIADCVVVGHEDQAVVREKVQ